MPSAFCAPCHQSRSNSTSAAGAPQTMQDRADNRSKQHEGLASDALFAAEGPSACSPTRRVVDRFT